MGNCCNRGGGKEQEDLRLELKEPEGVNQVTEMIENTLNPGMDFAVYTGPINMTMLFPEVSIVKLVNEFFSELTQHHPNANSMKKVSLETVFDGELFGLSLPKESSSELINVLIQKYKSVYSAEFLMWATINQIMTFNSSLDEIELLHCENHENTIYILERYKTKKVLMVSPRQMIILRVFKKLGEGKYMELSQTIDANNLINHQSIKELYEKIQDQFATTFIAGTYWEEKEGYCEVTNYARNDFHSSVSLKIVGIFIGKNFETYLKNVSENANIIWTEEHWNKKEKEIWFTKSEGGLRPLSFASDKQLAKVTTDSQLVVKSEA